MADRIGSLEPGKQADVVVHRADGWGWTPRGDVGLQLVWGTDGRSRFATCSSAGRAVVRDGQCITVDTDALWHEADAVQQSLLRPGRHRGPASLAADRRVAEVET